MNPKSKMNFHLSATSSGARVVIVFMLVTLLFSRGWGQIAPGSLDVQWNEGAANCGAHSEPPLQVHAYNAQTYILRESLCATFEAPFMYLLIGSKQALLIDTGDITDAQRVPLASTVIKLLPATDVSKLPLLVVHTHRHLDHRAGDAQFAHLADVRVVGYDLDSVRKFYGFADWPRGTGQIDLGDREVDVIPTPGHNETEVSFYDRNTGLLLSGDFLMPARLLVDDTGTYKTSAEHLANFVRERPVSYVLGGHIEMDTNGKMFPWESQYHPHEHALQLTKSDILALPAALAHFNGFYSEQGKFVFINSIRILGACATLLVALFVAMAWILVRFIQRRRARRRLELTGNTALRT